MKKLILVILLICVCAYDAFGGINKTLIDAKRMLEAAKTVAEYEAAKKKFTSAKLDVGYVSEEHDKFIAEGIRTCNARINELSNARKKDLSKINIHQDAGREPQLEIYDIEFANMQSDGTIINDYGTALYSPDMRFLHPRVKYRGLAFSQTETIKVKLINPQGELLAGQSAPDGFTQLCDVTFDSGTENTLSTIDGMGASTLSIFSSGVWTCELWIKNKKVFSAKVDIKTKEATYLMVDKRTSLSTSFDADGGMKVYNISTDGSDWSVYDVPDFCEVMSKSPTSLTLRCNANTSPYERKGSMKIYCGDKYVQIGVLQEAGKNIVFNRIWVDFNMEENGTKGLIIHVDFGATDVEQHTLNVTAYFEYSTGSPLKDTDGAYRSSDGRVAVEKTVTAKSYDSQWGDLKLFMPYSQIHTSSGNHSLRLYVQIYDKNTGMRENSGYTSFTFMN